MSLIKLKRVKIAIGEEEPKKKTEKQIFNFSQKDSTKKKILKKPKVVKNYDKPEEDMSLKKFLKIKNKTET